MKLITLIENSMGNNPDLECEFGFSTWIEDKDISLIFDTGQTGEFVNNIKKLKLDTSKVKNIILSHNHFDHEGGLEKYVEKYGNGFTLTVNKNFFDKRFIMTPKVSRFLSCNGLHDFLREHDVKINLINDHIHRISENITLFTNFTPVTEFEKPDPTFFRGEPQNLKPDLMDDEIVLGLNTSKGFVLLCGCSHIGIVNIVKNIENWTGGRVNGIIGGLHLSHAPAEKIKGTMDFIYNHHIRFLGVSHCTGDNVIEGFKSLSCEVLKNNTGNIFFL